MTNGTTILEARTVGRRASPAGKWLLRDVSFNLHGGDRLAIEGPTGAGKTLLLRSVALLDQVDAGEILWHGKSISAAQIPIYRSHVIYLHQRPALFEGSVEENLRRPFSLATHRGHSYDRSRVLDLLSVLDRGEPFLQKRHRDLSGGESQIVALLRAIQLDPEVLLLDEPTAALDADSTSAVEQLVDVWLKEQPLARAVVWVSHDAAQTERLATARLVLEAGRWKQGE